MNNPITFSLCLIAFSVALIAFLLVFGDIRMERRAKRKRKRSHDQK